MTISATEFKTNFGKYLEIVFREDIFITKNGKVIAQLTQPKINKFDILSSLIGIAKGEDDISLDEIREERLANK